MISTREGAGWQSGYRAGLSSLALNLLVKIKNMRIFRALGLALLIVILRALAPQIWTALESTLLSFFHVMQTLLASVESFATQGAGVWMAR